VFAQLKINSAKTNHPSKSKWKAKFSFRRKKEKPEKPKHGRSVSDAFVIEKETIAEVEEERPLVPPRAITTIPSPSYNYDASLMPLDQDPSGLQVLYQPKDEPIADVILVHSLGGGSRMTWSRDRDAELFWPLKFLSKEHTIDRARISSYGFNTDAQRMSVFDFATFLLLDLKGAKDEDTEEPLGIGEVILPFQIDL
jgi:hypothetical protein